MENLPETFPLDHSWGFPARATTSAASASSAVAPEELLGMLYSPSHMEEALSLLAKMRATCENLPLLLWKSFNTVFILLKEVLSAYRKLGPSMTLQESVHVCNAIALFQCIATHPQTRMAFLKANITCYLHPFLQLNTNGEKPLEFLRIASLGVIGALVKFEDQDGKEIVQFLLKSEVFPMCLNCLDVGDELTQTVSALIVMRILAHDEGLKYCCAYGERFFTLVQVLGRVVDKLPCDRRPSNLRLIKYIIWCYLRLTESPRAMDAFKKCIPARMTQGSFISMLHDDPQSAMMLQNLFVKITTHEHE